MRFLVTGVTGFVGLHLTELLSREGHEVFGTTRAVAGAAARRVVERLRLPPDRLLACDIRNRDELTAVVRRVTPDGIFHLAAFASPSASFDDPEGAYETNLTGSLNVFAAVRNAVQGCRIVWVGSSDAYGQVNADDLPVTERNLFRPLSPYAVSKAAADLAAYQWSRTWGLEVVRMRPFNHTGPGQAPAFMCSDFAHQLTAVRAGKRPAQIAVGNLDVVRDFSDVRDVVGAYLAAFQRGLSGEAYNVCSGIGRTPRSVLARLIELSGVPAEVVVQPERQRPTDVPVLIGSAAKLRNATGWTPRVDWDQTLCDLLNEARGCGSGPGPSP